MFTAFMLALLMTSVAHVLVLLAMGPLFTAALGRVVLKQLLPLRTWLAIVLAVMEIQNLINCIENNGLHYITCRLQMTWGQSDKVELVIRNFRITASDGKSCDTKQCNGDLYSHIFNQISSFLL